MAEKNLLVRLKLEGADQMAAGHEKVAKAAEHQAKATKSLADIDREREQSRRRVREALQDANRIEREPLANRQQSRGGGGGFPIRGFAALAGAEAISRGVLGAATGLVNAAAGDGSRGEAGILGGMARSAAESLPIIGSLTKAINLFADAASGATSQLAAAQRHLETANRMNATQSQVNAATRASRSEMFAFGRTAADAQIGAESARGFSDFVANNPNVRGQQLDIERARFGVREAEALAAQRRRELAGGLPSGMSAADHDALIAERQRNASAASATAADRERELRKAEGEFFTRESPKKAALAEASADAAVKEQQLMEARRAKEADINALKERQKAANEANLNLAQKQFELSKAEQMVQQDRLDKMKSLAQTLGGAQAGEAEEALRILEAIKAGGVGAVSPEEAQFAGRFAPQFVQQQQQIAGQNNPLFNQLQQFNQGNTAIGGQIGELEAALNASTAQAVADMKEAQAAAHKEFVTQIADAYAEALKLAIANIRSEMLNAGRQGDVQRAAAGG